MAPALHCWSEADLQSPFHHHDGKLALKHWTTFCLAFFLACPWPTHAARWTEVPVPGGDVRELAVLQDGRLFAVTPGAIYRSSDAGASWQRTASMPSFDVYEIGSVPGSQMRLLAYTIEQGALRRIEVSDDEGDTWRTAHTIGIGLPTTDKAVFAGHPSNPGLVLFSTNDLSLRSVDYGESWSVVDEGRYGRTSIVAVPGVAGRFVSARYVSNVPWISNDGGASWSALSLSQPLPGFDELRLAADPFDADRIYFIAYKLNTSSLDSGTIRLSDGSVTFFGPCDCAHVRIVPDPHRPGRLLSVVYPRSDFATYTGLSLRESLDGGTTWTQLPPFDKDIGKDYRLEFDPVVPGRLYAPTQGAGIYRSDDDGKSFQPRYSGMWHGQTVDLSVDPRDPQVFVIARRLLPMLRTRDGGATFQTVSTDFNGGNHPYPPRSRIARSSDNPDVMIGFDHQSLYSSVDGGATWSALPSNLTFNGRQLTAIGFVGIGDRHLVAASHEFRVWQSVTDFRVHWSEDGGQTWSSEPSPVYGLGFPVTSKVEGPIYLMSQMLQFVAPQFGQPWQRITLPPYDNRYSSWLSYPNPSNGTNRILSVKDENDGPWRLWETQDTGASWIELGLADTQFRTPTMDACDPRTLWQAAGDGSAGILVSRDKGRTFRLDTEHRDQSPGQMQNLCLNGKTYVFALGHGVLVRQAEDGSTLFRDGLDD